MANEVSLKWGKSSSLSTVSNKSGQVLLTTDNGALYVDAVTDTTNNTVSRVQIKDTTKYTKTEVDNKIKTVNDKIPTIPNGSGSVNGNATTFVKTVQLSGHTLSGTTQAADTAVTDAASSLPTTKAVKTYVDNQVKTVSDNLTGSMHFVGVSTTDPKSDTGATVSGHTTWKQGDVVLYNTKEFVLKANTNSKDNWIELGDEGSHALKSIKISAGTGLSGGGDLTTNRTISHATPSGAAAGTTSPSANQSPSHGGTFNIPVITTDSMGHVTGKSTTTVTLPSSGNVTSKFVVADSDVSVSNVSATTSNPFLNHVEGNAVNSTVQFVGAGSATISANNTGKIITITADKNTDTKVTSVGNHYTPTADTNYALSATASSSTAATWGTTQLVTGVSLTRDAKGHVTGVSVNSIKMPDNPNININYYHSTGSWSGLTYTATAAGGAPELKLTIPTGTTATTVAVGNHTHSYNNLTDKPTIPTVGNGTLKITDYSGTKTFTANQATGSTVEVDAVLKWGSF